MYFWRRRSTIIILICCAVAVTVAAQVGLPVGPLSIPAGLVMSFFAPGFAALLAFRPRRRPMTVLDFALSVPLSFVAAIVFDVLLDFTSVGLRLRPMALGLAILTLIFLVVAVWRDRGLSDRLPETSESSSARGKQTGRTNPTASLVRASLVGALVVAALWATYGIIRASQDRPPLYTELYVEQATPFTPGGDGPSEATLLIGVNNHEAEPITYTLKVVQHLASGQPDVPLSEQQVAVKAGGSWQGRITASVSCEDSAEAQLFVPNLATPYRSVQARFPCGTPISELTPTMTPATPDR